MSIFNLHSKQMVIGAVSSAIMFFTGCSDGTAHLGRLADADVKIYEIADNGKQVLKWEEETSSGNYLEDIGKFPTHDDDMNDNKFYLIEISKGEAWDSDNDGNMDTLSKHNNGKIRAIAKGNEIKEVGNSLNVTVVSEIVYQLVKDDLNNFNSKTFQAKLNNAATKVLSDDIDGNSLESDNQNDNDLDEVDKEKSNLLYNISTNSISNDVDNRDILTYHPLKNKNALTEQYYNRMNGFRDQLFQGKKLVMYRDKRVKKVENHAIVKNASFSNGISYTWKDVVGPNRNIWMDRNVGAQRVATSFRDGPEYDDGRGSGSYGAKFTWDNASRACPIGYRLPKENEWQAIVDNINPNDRGGAYSTVLKLTYAGFSNNRMYGTYGGYWDANEYDASDGSMLHLVDLARVSFCSKGYRLSVRCIKKQHKAIVKNATYPNGISYTWKDIEGPDGNKWMDRNVGAQRVATSFNDGPKQDDKHGSGSYGAKFTWHTAPKSCPTGYRLPTNSEWHTMASFFVPNNRYGAYNSVLKLPSAGIATTDMSMTIFRDMIYGQEGYYWSNTITTADAYAYILFFTKDGPIFNTESLVDNRLSIRCLKHGKHKNRVRRDAGEYFNTNVTDSYGNKLNYGFETITAEDGRIWMDRNVGATRVAKTYNDGEGQHDDGHGSGSYGGKFTWEDATKACPVGFRLPKLAEWKTEVNAFKSSEKNREAAIDSILKIPAAGNGKGTNNSYGTRGTYWTKDTDNLMSIWEDLITFYQDKGSYHFSVRCIKKEHVTVVDSFGHELTYMFEAITAEDGRIWMDRNVGATKKAIAYNDGPDSDDENGSKSYGGKFTWEDAMKACPVGFRLPTHKEWITEVETFEPYNRVGASDSNLLLPAAGNGKNYSYGDRGIYWTKDKDVLMSIWPPANDNSMDKWPKNTITFYQDKGSYLFSVRCIKYKDYNVTDSFNHKLVYHFDTVVGPAGQIWMDRNVGATRVAKTYHDGPKHDDGHGSGSYGGKFTWADANKACPTGYKVPSKDEFMEFKNYTVEQNRDGAFNSTLALPCDGHESNIAYGNIGKYWTSSKDGSSKYYLYMDPHWLQEYSISDICHFAVRCIKK